MLRRVAALVTASLLAVPPPLLAGGSPAPSGSTQGGDLGVPLPLFPANNWWNTDISAAPVDPDSAAYIAFIGGGTGLHPDFGGEVSPGSIAIYGMPYAVVDRDQPDSPALQTVIFNNYPEESDGVDHDTNQSFPFYPIPEEAKFDVHWIEGGKSGAANSSADGDRHLLIVDKTNNHLYELWLAHYNDTQGMWHAGSGAFYDMNTNNRRPEGWTSADAAGLAVLPGLVRYDEVYESADPIRHAFRMTVESTNGHVYPASHTAGSTAGALPMGARLRLKASTDISATRFPDAGVRKIFQAMKTYGLIVADNGSDMYIQGTFNTSWDNGVLNPAFGDLTASDFEVVELGFVPAGGALSIADASVTEADSGTKARTFTVTLSEASAATVRVDYATSNGTATAGTDYTAKSGTLVLAPDVTTKTVTVQTLGDTEDERNETFTVGLSAPQNASIADSGAVGTILDNDPAPPGAPDLAIANATLAEADAGTKGRTFTVTLSAPSADTVYVNYATADGTATAGTDYTAKSGTLTLAPGTTAKVFTVVTLGDTEDERNETFLVNLSAPVGAVFGDNQATGTINDNDP